MGRTNPFEKYLSKEQVMQAEIARLLALKHPNLSWWHTPNEGERTPFEQYLFKQMGGLSGVSDFVVLEEGNFSKGLMIEIKWGKNACTKKQVDFLVISAHKGYSAAVVYDHAPDVLDLIDRHLKSGVGTLPSEGIVLIKKGKQSLIPFDQCHQVLMKKSGPEKSDKEKAKELFKATAAKKFGNVSNGMKKLFQSPKKNFS